MSEHAGRILLAPAARRARRTALGGIAVVLLAASAAVVSARIVAPQPAIRLESRGDPRLPATLTALDAERIRLRAALAAARSPGARAGAAGGLATAYGRTALRLRALGAATGQVAAQLEATSAAYRDLARAASARDRTRYRSAAARVDAGESGLTAAVERPASRGAPATRSPVAEPAAAGPRVGLALLGALLTALAVVLIARMQTVRRACARALEAYRHP